MMRWLPAASAAIIVLAMVAIVSRDFPLVGHDYRYFVPRLIDTDLHLRVNRAVDPVVHAYVRRRPAGVSESSAPAVSRWSRR